MRTLEEEKSKNRELTRLHEESIIQRVNNATTVRLIIKSVYGTEIRGSHVRDLVF